MLPQEAWQQNQAQMQQKMQQYMQAPSTPGVPPPIASAGSPDIAPLCPQPRRALTALPQQTENHSSPGSPWPGQDSDELRELLNSGAAVVKAGQLIGSDGRALVGVAPFDSRPLSAVSTSAGPTPGPDERLSPQQGPPLARMKGVAEKPSLPSQVRKVFVGGVPQDLSQDDLYTIFTEYGGVKKAWLQRYRTSGNPNSTPPHNHRGFGFVIFYETRAVDQLLGDNFSKYIPLRDGRRLEVKRAVSSTDIGGEGAPPRVTESPVTQSRTPGQLPTPPQGTKWPLPLPLPAASGSANIPDRSLTPNPGQQQQQLQLQQQYAMMAQQQQQQYAMMAQQGGGEQGAAAMRPQQVGYGTMPQQPQQQQQLAYATMPLAPNGGAPQMGQANIAGRMPQHQNMAMGPLAVEGQQNQWIPTMPNGMPGMQTVIAAMPSAVAVDKGNAAPTVQQQQWAMQQWAAAAATSTGQPAQQQQWAAAPAMGGQVQWPVAPNAAVYGMVPGGGFMRPGTPQQFIYPPAQVPTPYVSYA